MAGRIRGGFMSGLLATLSARGAEAAPILHALGVRPGETLDAGAFVDLEAYLACYEDAARALPDDALGLHIGSSFNLYSLAPVFEQATVREALHALGRIVATHLEGASVELHTDGGTAALVYHVDVATPATRRQHVEAVVAIAMRVLRHLAAGRWKPAQVRMQHAPPASVKEHERVFGIPFAFAQPVNAIFLDARHLDARTSQAVRSALGVADEAADDWLDGVRKLVIRALPDGHPPVASVAAQLSLSVRTFQRRLAEQGFVYKKLVEDVRRQLALQHLEDATVELTELAFLLGYSELSAFDRAFRQWIGATPSEYRRSRIGPPLRR